MIVFFGNSSFFCFFLAKIACMAKLPKHNFSFGKTIIEVQQLVCFGVSLKQATFCILFGISKGRLYARQFQVNSSCILCCSYALGFANFFISMYNRSLSGIWKSANDATNISNPWFSLSDIFRSSVAQPRFCTSSVLFERMLFGDHFYSQRARRGLGDNLLFTSHQ